MCERSARWRSASGDSVHFDSQPWRSGWGEVGRDGGGARCTSTHFHFLSSSVCQPSPLPLHARKHTHAPPTVLFHYRDLACHRYKTRFLGCRIKAGGPRGFCRRKVERRRWCEKKRGGERESGTLSDKETEKCAAGTAACKRQQHRRIITTTAEVHKHGL